MIEYFSHAGEDHSQPGVSLATRLLHQPTWVELLAVGVILSLIFVLSRKLQFNKRLMLLTGSMIVIGIGFMPHNPTVTGVVLSIGFITTFLLTFTMLSGVKHK